MAPKPEAVEKLRRGRIERLLKAHRISRLKAEDILAGLKVRALQLARPEQPKRSANTFCCRFRDFIFWNSRGRM